MSSAGRTARRAGPGGFFRQRIADFHPWATRGAPTGSGGLLIASALFLQGVLALSPIFPSVGVRGVYIYSLVYLVSAYELIFNRKRIPLTSIYLCVVVFLGSCVAGLYWQNPKLAMVSLFFIGSVIIASLADRGAVQTFITILTYFTVALLVLCWIGFFYKFQGGKGLFTIHNMDGRENIFYLTTFSNYAVLNTIRPSGIFDEPGALSFVVCALAALRNIYNRNDVVSISVLQLGTVVFGFTHYIFMLFYLMFMRNAPYGSRIFLLSVVVAINVAEYYILKDALDTLFMWKFNYSPDTNAISGDNRSTQAVLAFSKSSLSTMLWGIHPSGVLDINAFKRVFGGMSENPLGPLVTSGAFVSFPYYYILTSYVLKGLFSKENRIYLAIAILFVPRPYIASYGYSVFAVLFFLAMGTESSEPCCVSQRKPPGDA